MRPAPNPSAPMPLPSSDGLPSSRVAPSPQRRSTPDAPANRASRIRRTSLPSAKRPHTRCRSSLPTPHHRPQLAAPPSRRRSLPRFAPNPGGAQPSRCRTQHATSLSSSRPHHPPDGATETDPVPAQSANVQRGSPQVHSSRFEVPLRPELWSSVFSPP
ncbi:proline-rich receptor-like protein kinase PERK10 isoform X7 [Panicum virgatum]|uniref:proline-rich receptor-like protein kinase PERK10 isoform X7 n=1 Tax=Panicum virgatum TaxID=38727 RepID=UPI0019D628BA|nr:proline-rich receptor-like protein kinase PERK10 isoform X7 [Panicum virgatum]